MGIDVKEDFNLKKCGLEKMSVGISLAPLGTTIGGKEELEVLCQV